MGTVDSMWSLRQYGFESECGVCVPVCDIVIIIVTKELIIVTLPQSNSYRGTVQKLTESGV